MNSKSKYYKDLEILASGRTRPCLRIQFSKGLHWLIERLIRALTAAHEPKIQKIQTRDGHILFDVYDPVTQERIQAVSEEEVHIWLEQRYNR